MDGVDTALDGCLGESRLDMCLQRITIVHISSHDLVICLPHHQIACQRTSVSEDVVVAWQAYAIEHSLHFIQRMTLQLFTNSC